MPRNVARRSAPALRLPAEPPTLHIPPPVWPWDPDFMAGNSAHVAPTMFVFLRNGHARGGRQTMIYAGKKFHAWCDVELAWRTLAIEELHATLYRFLRAKSWGATPKHIRKLVAMLQLELHWPRPAAIWRAA